MLSKVATIPAYDLKLLLHIGRHCRHSRCNALLCYWLQTSPRRWPTRLGVAGRIWLQIGLWLLADRVQLLKVLVPIRWLRQNTRVDQRPLLTRGCREPSIQLVVLITMQLRMLLQQDETGKRINLRCRFDLPIVIFLINLSIVRLLNFGISASPMIRALCPKRLTHSRERLLYRGLIARLQRHLKVGLRVRVFILCDDIPIQPRFRVVMLSHTR